MGGKEKMVMPSVAETFVMPDCQSCIQKGEDWYLCPTGDEPPKRKAEWFISFYKTTDSRDSFIKTMYVCGPCADELAKIHGGTRQAIGQYEKYTVRAEKVKPVQIDQLDENGKFVDGKMLPNTISGTTKQWNRMEENWVRA